MGSRSCRLQITMVGIRHKIKESEMEFNGQKSNCLGSYGCFCNNLERALHISNLMHLWNVLQFTKRTSFLVVGCLRKPVLKEEDCAPSHICIIFWSGGASISGLLSLLDTVNISSLAIMSQLSDF